MRWGTVADAAVVVGVCDVLASAAAGRCGC